MQDRVRELFNVLIKGGQDGSAEEKDDIVRIDAGASVEEVQRRVTEEVGKCLERVDGEDGKLRIVGEW